MQNFIRGTEMSIFGALVGAANATGRQRQTAPQTRVIRQTSRRSLDELIVALRAENARANRLEAENADLRRRLANANKIAVEALLAARR